jgi:hypothetical protein
MNPANTFYSVKRLIGQEFEAVEDEATRLAYTVTSDEDGFAVLECRASESGASCLDGAGDTLGPLSFHVPPP